MVLAAASLTETFEDLARTYEADHPGERVTLSFAGTPTLAAQVAAGAPADVLATADEPTMSRLWVEGEIGKAYLLATNRLVLITPADDPAGIHDLRDVARPGVRLVLAGEAVPAGRYAREALAGLGILDAAEANLVSAPPDVKAVVSAVVLGEADAGVVYATDATVAVREDVRVFGLPESVSPKATYAIGIVRDSPHPEGARAFVDYALSAAGREVLARHGFRTP